MNWYYYPGRSERENEMIRRQQQQRRRGIGYPRGGYGYVHDDGDDNFFDSDCDGGFGDFGGDCDCDGD